MELFQLEAFLAVVREGSFSAAAKALYRTQPAISQTIKKLEDEIGRPLFDRSSRRGVLTDAGRVLADHAERLVNLRTRTMSALDDVRQLRTGRLTVAANELTCLYLLPILHEYRRLYPDIQLTVQRALGSRVPAQVLDYGADFGLITFRPDTSALQSSVGYNHPLSLVVAPSPPLARRPNVSITELASESFVAHHVSSPYRQKVIDTFRKRRVELRMPVEMPTIDAIKKFVAMGNGVALLPAITVERELAHRELVRVQVPELAFDRKLRLIHRREGTLSHAAEALLTVVEAQSALKRGRFAFAVER
jgi:DNA-binding transcriptional LysR family regulator